MTFYWSEIVSRFDSKSIDPAERYDITDERYFIPNHITEVSLRDLLDYPYLNISNGSLLSVCSNQEYLETHSRNHFITSKDEHCFHSVTFEEVKNESAFIHSTFGLSAEALVELAYTLKLFDGLNNHSYVRICPELIFSFSLEMKEEINNLESDHLEGLAKDWQKAVLSRYKVEKPENVNDFWFGWITHYDQSHYTLEYFTDLLLNIHELIRSCDQEETIFVSVDY